MLRNVLIGVLVLLVVLIVVDSAHRSRRAPAPPPSPAAMRATGQPAARDLPASTPIRPAVAAVDSSVDTTSATPALDMMARLAVRRRLDREGDHVYLDSLLAHTDSVLTRWTDRSTLSVALVADTTLPGWSPALLGEVRAAMHAWDTNGSGMAFRETSNADSADIKVNWVVALRDSGQIGATTLNWGSDGVVHSAIVNLALRRSPDSSAVPAAIRIRAAIHELGHALGLPHSGDPDDVMFRLASAAEPSPRDQATLRLLYAVPPGPLRIQP